MQFRVIPDIDQDVVEVDADGDGDAYGDDERDRVARLLAEAIGDASFDASRMSSTTTKMAVKRRAPSRRRAIGVDALVKSLLTGTAYSGRYFIYLMSTSVASKTDSHVGYTTNPLVELFCHNHRLFVNRDTCMAAPHWMLDIVLGPFASKEQAIECGRAWVVRTRGKEPKRKKAADLAASYNVDMYSFKEEGDESMEALLARFAPRDFVSLYDEMALEYGLSGVVQPAH